MENSLKMSLPYRPVAAVLLHLGSPEASCKAWLVSEVTLGHPDLQSNCYGFSLQLCWVCTALGEMAVLEEKEQDLGQGN